MKSEYGSHYSILKNEIVKIFFEEKRDNYFFADLTFGGGGHSFSFLSHDENAKVIGLDQDPDAIKNAQEMITKHNLEERLFLIKNNFENFSESFLKLNKTNSLDGILLDIGVSSHQFDQFERGFSFRGEAPLDMRMAYDNDNVKTAAELLNSLSELEISNLLWDYAEEKSHKVIAKNIVKARSEKEIKTTKDLEEIVFHSYPKKLRHGKINPATKTFQALRIAVNRELDVLTNVIPKLVPLLSIGAPLAIITFHSLEDRIVKHLFKKLNQESDLELDIVTKKPILPSDEEILENSRSRSAKLRVLKRVLKKKTKNKYQR